MSAKKPTTQPKPTTNSKDGLLKNIHGEYATPEYMTYNGVTKFKRNCWTNSPHTPHLHTSYYWDEPGKTSTDKRDNTWCDGTGNSPTIHTSYTPSKPKKDYSEDPETFPVSNPITIQQARAIAHHMHRDQTDKSNRPYGEHLNAVEQGVKLLGGSSEERIAALFHDSIEDFHTTEALLKKINLTPHTIDMILAVSKHTGEEQNHYLNRIIECGEGAMRVKLADLIHNTRHDRIKALPQHTQDRLLKKYRPAIARLMLELGIITDEDSQKKLATKPIGSATGSYYSSGHSSTSKSTPTSAKTSSSKKTTTKPHTPEPTTWSVNSLFRGDWVIGWSAPVLERSEPGKDIVEFILANGEVVAQPRYVKGKEVRLETFTFEEWSNDPRVNPYEGLTEDDVIAYDAVITDAKHEVAKTDDTDLDVYDEHGGFLWDSGLH